MDVPDSIRRELTLEAPRDRVWLALTDAKQLVRWLPTTAAEVALRPGGALRFSWADMTDEGHEKGWTAKLEELRALVETWAA